MLWNWEFLFPIRSRMAPSFKPLPVERFRLVSLRNPALDYCSKFANGIPNYRSVSWFTATWWYTISPYKFYERLAKIGRRFPVDRRHSQCGTRTLCPIGVSVQIAPILIVPPNASEACLGRVVEIGSRIHVFVGASRSHGSQLAMQRPAQAINRSPAKI